MKTIIFIGCHKSGSSREAIKSAERLGYFTVLLTDSPTQLEKRTEFPDVHLMVFCDLMNYKKIKETIDNIKSRDLDICSIISFVDPHCHTACQLADEFGVNNFTTRAVGKMENKIYSREALLNSPFSPKYITLSENATPTNDELEINFPIIMKSPDSAGSKDVYKVDNIIDFKNCKKQLNEMHPHKPILIEEFLEGPQYLIETLVYKGKVHIIAVIEQEISFFDRFIVTGYNYIAYPESEFYNKLKSAVESIIEMHGMLNGSCHFEMRLVNDQWKLIEVNPRISGCGMNRMIEIATGINLVEATLKFALGQDFNIHPKHNKYVYARYLTVSKVGILEKVTGKCAALNSPGVEDVYIKPRKGALLTPPLSMGNRYAYVIATGKSESEAKNNAMFAISKIEFVLKEKESD